ncbi:MAG: flagellar biosynthetic protein FliR [Treponema sp.]|nr:flagellar biosynthetic protein FliR [Treponema sp.]
MFDSILSKAPQYLLVFVRCFALILTLPLFSMRSVSRVAKVALAGYMAFFIFPTVDYGTYNPFLGDNEAFSLEFIFLALGEGLIGVIMGFYIQIIFAAFSTAGQFFAFQMGFSAASAYDALAQVENPLMGQYLNLVSMLVFMQTKWFQKLFLGGLMNSFDTLNVFSIISGREKVLKFMLSGLTKLFADAMVIALPILGTLLLITVCTGLLSKAAPQMNLLSEGFPIMILLAFFLIATVFPSLVDFFVRSFSGGFEQLTKFILSFGGGS